MLLPGPEAQQLATYLGYKLHGVKGALATGGLFILPGALVMFGLSWLAAAHGEWPPLQAVFRGLLPVVFALVLHAVYRIGSRTLRTPTAWAMAVGALVGLLLGAPFPLIVVAALGIGAALGRAPGAIEHDPQAPDANVEAVKAGAHARRFVAHTLGFGLIGVAPIIAAIALFGPEPFAEVAALFGKSAFVTFGGAYAVLPYIAESAVEQYRWLTPDAMIHGLALAETTPGPLILVTQYVGFFAGWNAALAGHAGGLAPLGAAAVAAAITTWCTFVPSFYFVIAGAPLIETLTHNRRIAAALAGVTAAVVGVIASLCITIGEAAFLPAGRIDGVALGLAAAAFILLVKFRLGPLWLVLIGAAAGLLRWLGGV